ncbi:MAG TPA: PaaI family thioesterase [Xanthobacteraceae bacterium]|nr:PaaI family thioesterase [Xanthobacteraceae bacterium]
MNQDDVPEGFERHTRRSGFTEPWEPIYARRSGADFRLGFRGAAPHANSRGFIHGGLISALADNAMGLSCGYELKELTNLVTVSLSIDFVGSARIGQWIEIRPEVVKIGKSLCFARALVTADDLICARASGIFMNAAPRSDSASPSTPQRGLQT